MYIATNVVKLVSVDHYKTGVETQHTITVDDQISIQSDTLQGLVDTIADWYCFDIDSLWAAEGTIQFDARETAEGLRPTAEQREEWKQGKLTLYLCTYTFEVGKIVPIDDELQALNEEYE